MILDAGPLIDVDRNRRRLAALVKVALDRGETLITTEAIVAQVWRGPNQANLAAALKAIEIVDRFGDGRKVGELLAASGTSDPIDAHLAVLARMHHKPILTADVADFARLSAVLPIEIVSWAGQAGRAT